MSCILVEGEFFLLVKNLDFPLKAALKLPEQIMGYTKFEEP